MPATIQANYTQRLGNKTAELGYWIHDAADAIEARLLLAGHAPNEFDGKVQEDLTVSEVKGAQGLWEASVRYKPDEDDEPGGNQQLPVDASVDSFEIAAASTTVYLSRDTIQTIAGPGVAEADIPDFQRHIGVDADDRVNGVQWPPPGQVMARSAAVAASKVNQPYYRTLAALAGRVNSAAFMGFEPRELMFLGVSGTRRVRTEGSSPWDLTYRFQTSVEGTNLPIAPGVVLPQKDGWDYLWTYSRSEVNATRKWKLPRVIAAYVERIAAEASFEVLNP